MVASGIMKASNRRLSLLVNHKGKTMKGLTGAILWLAGAVLLVGAGTAPFILGTMGAATAIVGFIQFCMEPRVPKT